MPGIEVFEALGNAFSYDGYIHDRTEESGSIWGDDQYFHLLFTNPSDFTVTWKSFQNENSVTATGTILPQSSAVFELKLSDVNIGNPIDLNIAYRITTTANGSKWGSPECGFWFTEVFEIPEPE